MAKKYVVAVPKGGVGKTTIVRNLGEAMAQQVEPSSRSGKKICFVELDPTGNLSQGAGVRPRRLQHTIYTSMSELVKTFRSNVRKAIIPLTDSIDLIPANALLNRANDEFSSALQKEQLLQRLLKDIEEDYTVIIADTLPYLGLLTNNGFAWANEVIIPLQPEPDAIESVAVLLEHLVNLVSIGLNNELAISGLLFSQVQYTNLHKNAISFAYDAFGPYVQFFDQILMRSIMYPEARSQYQSIFTYKPNSPQAQVFSDLAKAILAGEKRISLKDIQLREGFLDEIFEGIDKVEDSMQVEDSTQ